MGLSIISINLKENTDISLAFTVYTIL